jgi:hypothetical protein
MIKVDKNGFKIVFLLHLARVFIKEFMINRFYEFLLLKTLFPFF